MTTGSPTTPRKSREESEGNALDLSALLRALQSVALGDFSVRLPGDRVGLEGKIADTFNDRLRLVLSAPSAPTLEEPFPN